MDRGYPCLVNSWRVARRDPSRLESLENEVDMIITFEEIETSVVVTVSLESRLPFPLA